MSEVVRSVQRVTDIMGEFASASVEQNTGIEQVNVAVTQIDEVTRQNAALVEQASAAAQAMADQAETLRAAVSVFKVGDAGHSSAAANSLISVTRLSVRGRQSVVVARKATGASAATGNPVQQRPSALAEQDWQTF